MQRFFNAALDVYKYFLKIYWKNMHDDDWHTKNIAISKYVWGKWRGIYEYLQWKWEHLNVNKILVFFSKCSWNLYYKSKYVYDS